MVKTRVHSLAKDLGIEPKDLIAHLEKMGIKGKKSQGSVEDDGAARIRAALATPAKPQVHVGEEKVVADRVVTAEDQSRGEIQAREKIVERRVRVNVIRRRTSRSEVISQGIPAKAESPEAPVEIETPLETVSIVSPPAEVEVVPEPAREEPPAEEATPVEAKAVEAVPVPPAVVPEERVTPAVEKAVPVPEEAPRGARVLGRIDLKRTTRVPTPPPLVPLRPVAVQPGRPLIDKEKAAKVVPAPGKEVVVPVEEAGKPSKAVRHKKRIVKKQDMLESRERELRSGRFPKKKRALPGKEQKKTEITVPKASKRVIKMSEVISVGDLARIMGGKAGEVSKKLMGLGMMATINQILDVDTATLIASEFDHQVENVAFDVESALEVEHQIEESETFLQPRPPVVTIMGHVEHGKPSLLDAIRSPNVTAREAGGITQHIGAYHVQVDGRGVTFLDTPGHEAFTAMRARGAKVTDIVVLVVAADDGVMPQTVEAINHAKAAKVPIIVAINKIDLPTAEPKKIRQSLTEYGLVSEEWGGDTIFAEVSAKKGIGIKELLEMILLQAEMLELKVSPKRPAKGAIIEAKLDKGRGPVATVLVHEGTVKIGDAFVSGGHCGRVRAR